jgi:hypothetical protein
MRRSFDALALAVRISPPRERRDRRDVNTEIGST